MQQQEQQVQAEQERLNASKMEQDAAKQACEEHRKKEQEEAERKAAEEIRKKEQEEAERKAAEEIRKKEQEEAECKAAEEIRKKEPEHEPPLEEVMHGLDAEVEKELLSIDPMKLLPSEIFTLDAEQQVTRELEKLSENEFRSKVTAAKAHPLFSQYCEKQLEDLGLEEGDWEFGTDEEFLDMVGWLQWIRVVEQVQARQAANGTAAHAKSDLSEDSKHEAPVDLGASMPEEQWDYGHSQRDYWGSRGEAWWNPSGWYEPSWGWARQQCYSHPYWSSHLSKWAYRDADENSNLGSDASTNHEEVRFGLLNRKSTENLSELGGDGASPIPTPKNTEDDDDTWRKNKKGELLSPKALYMKFYREIRSTLVP